MSKPALHKSGDIYGDVMLTGKSYSNMYGNDKQKFVEVVCVCGKIFYPLFYNLRTGRTKSCGCKTNYYIHLSNTTHGLSVNREVHPIVTAYRNMIARCYDEKNISYNSHGKRGIRVCQEWLDSPQAFYDWSLANGWKEELSLDRYPDNEKGNYDPSNCRWATDEQQMRNRRNNVFLTAFGETKLLVEWLEDDRCVVAYNTIRKRIKKYKWSPEDAIIKSPQIHNKCPARQHQTVPI